ncbi:putative methyltransferase At1g22800, mitochondrial [Glycine soja]|uniref:putative methyltransferase At1g22800, mitochondrial n=1 Tax=Glycine soja TaxID=3848 RepID=UPI00104034EA|nr:putative methyltransferase At1g22800, mitochondrial [Glycine soja]
MDDSYDMLQACKNAHHNAAVETHFLVADQDSVDLVVSCLGLHWTNLPGAMIQSRLALKPDGLFLAVILGGETLKKLKIACTLAQMEREGGISPRVSPLAQDDVVMCYLSLSLGNAIMNSMILCKSNFILKQIASIRKLELRPSVLHFQVRDAVNLFD